MKTILNKMKEAKVFASIEVDYNSPMASSQFASKKRAMEDLQSLEQEYASKLATETVAIVVYGDESEKFANLAANTGLTTESLDGNVINVLNSINPDIYLNQGLSIDTAMMVDSILQEISNSVGLSTSGINLEKVKQGTVINSQEEFVNIFVDLITESDPDLFSALSMLSVSKVALENNIGKKPGVFPVVLTTSNQNVLNSVINTKLFKKVITVSAGQSQDNNVDYALEKVDETNVEKTLTTIKKSLKEK